MEDKFDLNKIEKNLNSFPEFKEINKEAKKRMLDKNNMDKMSKALTHYLFRNGPIEEIHSDGKISQEDMKILNKYMVNRIGSVLECIYNEDWLKLELVLAFNSMYGKEWDRCEPDFTEINAVFENIIKNNGSSAFPTSI